MSTNLDASKMMGYHRLQKKLITKVQIAKIFMQKNQMFRMIVRQTVSLVIDDPTCDAEQSLACHTRGWAGKQLPCKTSQSRKLGFFFSPPIQWTRIHGNSGCQQIGIKFCSMTRNCVTAWTGAASDILHAILQTLFRFSQLSRRRGFLSLLIIMNVLQ